MLTAQTQMAKALWEMKPNLKAEIPLSLHIKLPDLPQICSINK